MRYLTFLHCWDYFWKCDLISMLWYRYKIQETKNSNLFIWQKPYSRHCQMPYSIWRRLKINRWQFLKEIVLKQFQSLFRRSNRDVFWENEGKMHKRLCVKEVFFKKLQAVILILIKRTPSNGFLLFLCKMLEKYLWNNYCIC